MNINKTHPIIRLFKNHEYDELSDNFLQSLEALLFLNPFNKEETCVYRNVPNYTVTDILITKLTDNLRRLYAANKACNNQKLKDSNIQYQKNNHYNSFKLNTEPLHNEKELIIQQDFIYKAFDILNKHTFFNNKKILFTQAILGKDFYLQSIDLFAYLGLHAFIQPHNFDQHIQIMKNYLQHTPMIFSYEILSEISNLIHAKKQHELIILILENSEIESLCQATFHNFYKSKDSWLLTVVPFLFNNNTLLNDEVKTSAASYFLKHSLLDSQFFSEYIPKLESQLFLENLNHYITIKNLSDSSFINNIVTNMSIHNIAKKHTFDFLIQHVITLEDVILLYKIISTNVFNDEQKEKLFNLYNFSDLSLLKELATTLHLNIDPQRRFNVMSSFLDLNKNTMHKDIMTHIISMDCSYMPLYKSNYLHIKLSDTIDEKSEISHKFKNKL